VKKRWTSVLLLVVMVVMLPVWHTTAKAANSYVMLSVPWKSINQCGHQTSSGPCQAYCWAYCRMILDRKAHTYSDYWISGVGGVAASTAGYQEGAKVSSTQELLKKVYAEINKGRPVMVQVDGYYGTYHYVVAIGYRADCDPKNLRASDILILDPANSAIQSSAGTRETYTFLSSCTLSTYRYWIATSGSASLNTPDEDSATDEKTETKSTTGQQYTIHFYAGSKDAVPLTTSKVVKAGEPYGTLPVPARNGFTFDGWYTAMDGGKQITASTELVKDADHTLYAHWVSASVKTYTVTFESNGGSVVSAQTVVSGKQAVQPTAPTRKGYTFSGWYQEKEGKNKWDFQKNSVTSNITLYAKWNKTETEKGATTPASSGGTASQKKIAHATQYDIYVDGVKMKLNAYALKDPATGYDINYLRLRDVAEILNGTESQFEVIWNAKESSIEALTHHVYTKIGNELETPFHGDQIYEESQSPFLVDGKTVHMEAIILTDQNSGGYNYFKLRDLGEVLHFGVDWNGEKGRIEISTGEKK